MSIEENIVNHEVVSKLRAERILVLESDVKRLALQTYRLEKVNAELTKALAGIDITYAARRKDKTVFINAHVSQEIHDLLWKIKEMRGQG